MGGCRCFLYYTLYPLPQSPGGSKGLWMLTSVVLDIRFMAFLSYPAFAPFPVFPGITFQIKGVCYQMVSQAVLGLHILKAWAGGVG